MRNCSQGLETRYVSLKDKSVLVSGGASGIGLVMVEAFARQGSKVGFVDILDSGLSLEERLLKKGYSVLFKKCDLTDIEAYKLAITRIEEENGPVEILVNNAADDMRHRWESVSVAEFDKRIAINLRHMFFAIQKVAQGMISAGNGSIINLGSSGWMLNSGGYPIYAASKAAVSGLTRSFARDLGKDGIRVNTLIPGWVMTEKQLNMWVDDKANALIDNGQCLAGRVKAEDIANMALFLGSDDSRMCSCQNFIVDGGWV